MEKKCIQESDNIYNMLVNQGICSLPTSNII